MIRISLIAWLLGAGIACSSPTMPREPDAIRTPDIAAPARMIPLKNGMTYLEGVIELMDHRMVITQAPYVDVTIKNRTSRDIEIEYRFRYFEAEGRELFTNRSTTFSRIVLGPQEVRVLPSEPYRGEIATIGIDIRWPVNREP